MRLLTVTAALCAAALAATPAAARVDDDVTCALTTPPTDTRPLPLGAPGEALAGLPWGASAKTPGLSALMARHGFKVSRPAAGPQPEMVLHGTHGRFEPVDRGARLLYKGLAAGLDADVHLVFGKHDRLERVLVSIPWRAGDIAHAYEMMDASQVFHYQLLGAFKTHQLTERVCDDPWVDTAVLSRGASQQVQYVRGQDGFMFSPSFRTNLVIHLVP